MPATLGKVTFDVQLVGRGLASEPVTIGTLAIGDEPAVDGMDEAARRIKRVQEVLAEEFAQ